MTNEFDINGMYCKSWIAKNETAIIQVIHGLGEMTDYYEELGEFFSDRGISVYMSEHRSHGRTTRSDTDGDVIDNIVDDLLEFTGYIRSKTQAPLYILGHSLGSNLSQLYMKREMYEIAGIVLVGCAEFNDLDQMFNRVCEEAEKNGLDQPCMDTFLIMFQDVAQKYKNEKYSVSWVTTDEERAAYYQSLPYTNKFYSNRFYKGFLYAMLETRKAEFFNSIQKKTPVFIASGTEDIMSRDGEIPKQKALQLENSGFHVTLRIYEGMRHSILQEQDRKSVFNDILEFLKA